MWTIVYFMVKNVDSSKLDPTRLRALRAEKPASQMGQVRWAWPDIKAALACGHSLTTIHRRLEEIGIPVSYRRLSFYIGRLRQEERNNPATVLPPVPDMPAGTDTAPPAHDPLANLRKYGKPPGFEWDESAPDKNKLF